MPPETSFGKNLQFQPHAPNMATTVGPMQGTGQTNALEMVLDQPPPLFVVPSLVVPTISNTRPRYSTQ
jgi:hypothetical protein